MRHKTFLRPAVCLAILITLMTAGMAEASSGTVTCGNSANLIDAITAANNAGSPTTINLVGTCLLTTPATVAGASAHGQDGLPIITGDVTIVGGTIARSQAAGTPLFRIFEVAGGGKLTLRGITITGGKVNGDGGGIYNNTGGTLTLDSTTLTANQAVDSLVVPDVDDTTDGGGLQNHGLAMVVNSTVSKNSVMTTVPGQPTGGEALGGGLSSEAGTLVVKRSRIMNNHAQGAAAVFDGSFGGGLEVSLLGASLTMEDSFVQGNTVSGWTAIGAGLHLERPATITRSTITGNVATATHEGGPPPCEDEVHTACNTGSAFAGAAVWNQSNLVMTDSSIVNNTATATGSPHPVVEGAGLTNTGSFNPRPPVNPFPGRAELTRTAVAANVAQATGSQSEVRGAGIANQDGIVANQRGPGDPAASSFLQLHASVVTGNLAQAVIAHGGGIYNYVNEIQEHPTSEPGGGRTQQVVTLDQGTIVVGNRPNNCEQQSGVIPGCITNPI